MTEQITVPKQTWDALREALDGIEHFSDAVDFNSDPLSISLSQWIKAGREALTAANAVSVQPILSPDAARAMVAEVDMNDRVLAAIDAEPQAQGERGICGEIRGTCGLPCEPCEGKPDPWWVTKQPQTPYANCRFKICDLPGQCKGEGKCHHPAVPQAIVTRDADADHGMKLSVYSDPLPATEPAVKESLTAQDVPAWRPIESAPKDGTPYLALGDADMWVENEPEGHLAGVWSWSESRGQWRGHAHADDRFATHWMPLPAAPEAP